MPAARCLAALAFLLSLTGCITRIVTVQSDPTGALVYLNGQEIGRTPVSREFQWYGNFDVILRKDGYETLKTHAEVGAPLWQWIPLDILTDLLPVTDEHTIFFKMEPQPPENPATVLTNGEQLRQMLESSGRTKEHVPTTRPAPRRSPATTKGTK